MAGILDSLFSSGTKAAEKAASSAAAKVSDPMSLLSKPSVAGGGLGGIPSITGGNATSSASSDGRLDASGWNVNFGEGGISSNPAMMTYMLIGAAALVALFYFKKSKG